MKWCALGDLVRICNGRDYKTLSAGDVPVYGSGGVMIYVSDYLSVGPTVLIPRKGSLDNIYFVEGQFGGLILSSTRKSAMPCDTVNNYV